MLKIKRMFLKKHGDRETDQQESLKRQMLKQGETETGRERQTYTESERWKRQTDIYRIREREERQTDKYLSLIHISEPTRPP